MPPYSSSITTCNGGGDGFYAAFAQPSGAIAVACARGSARPVEETIAAALDWQNC